MPPLHKVFVGCRACRQSACDREKLFKCGGCQIALYCSKACQKADWAVHRVSRKLNQREVDSGMPSETMENFKRLCVFCSKHRPTILNYGLQALDLPVNDYSRSLSDVIHLTVQHDPNASCPGSAFKAIDVDVVTFNSFSPDSVEDVRAQLEEVASQRQQAGSLDGCMTVIVSVLGEEGSDLRFISTIGFDNDSVKALLPGRPHQWKVPFLGILNNGILF